MAALVLQLLAASATRPVLDTAARGLEDSALPVKASMALVKAQRVLASAAVWAALDLLALTVSMVPMALTVVMGATAVMGAAAVMADDGDVRLWRPGRRAAGRTAAGREQLPA
jgi:hypothetical protein